MQDVSRVTGNPVIISFGGRDYIIRSMTFEDFGVIQKMLVDEKRRAIISTAAAMVKELGDSFPFEERKKMLDDARKEAGRVGFITNEELYNYVQSNEGSVKLLWACFERQYPQTFTQTDIFHFLATQVLTEEKIAALMAGLIGGGQGNLTGQASGADQPVATAPLATTPS
jgi:hypothetical protein